MKLICVGKIKEKYLNDAIDEYKKRLSKYTQIEIIEVLDVNYDDIKKSMEQEEESIMRYIRQKDYVITLEIEGKQITSKKLSDIINETQQINSNILFVIGGSNGLTDNIKKRSNLSLSFSKLTFPHQLFRVMLLEQLYRGFKILNNEKYHK